MIGQWQRGSSLAPTPFYTPLQVEQKLGYVQVEQFVRQSNRIKIIKLIIIRTSEVENTEYERVWKI